ncbi:DNA polymerase III subunit delta [Aedoeadaptatus ivorii]|nr:DNA polymerase III subunit delta [Peptoniphilus ivorii]
MDTMDYKGAYLLHGPEKYGMEERRRKIEEKYIDAAMRDLNYDVAAPVAEEIIAKANTLPFMSEKRMVVVKDSGVLAGAPDIDAFLEAVFEIPDSTILLLLEGETAIRKNQKLYTRFKKRDRLIAMERPKGRQLRNYIASYLAGYGRKIRPEVMERFIRQSGYEERRYEGDLRELVNTLDQIVSISGKEVTAEAVDSFMVLFSVETIFDLLDAVAKKDAPRMLRLLDEFEAKEEPAPRILYMIARQTGNFLFYKYMRATGLNDAEVFRYMGVKPYEGKKIAANSRGLSEAQLKRHYALILSAERKMKTSSGSDRAVMEGLLLDMLRV